MTAKLMLGRSCQENDFGPKPNPQPWSPAALAFLASRQPKKWPPAPPLFDDRESPGHGLAVPDLANLTNTCKLCTEITFSFSSEQY